MQILDLVTNYSVTNTCNALCFVYMLQMLTELLSKCVDDPPRESYKFILDVSNFI